MSNICKTLEGLKPAIFMVFVTVIFAGMNIFYKLAANDGMNLTVMIAYRFVFAAAFIVPLALYVERNTRPKMTCKVMFMGFLCGLFGGCAMQNLYIASLNLTSATFTSAITNLTPVVTFTLAVLLRLEKLGLGTIAGKAKVAGTTIGLGGAMLLTLYTGVEVKIWSTQINLLKNDTHGHVVASSGHNQVWGALLALAACVSFSISINIQAKMARDYPCPFSISAIMCFSGAILAVLFALIMERDWNQWKLGWNIRLLSVAYLGIFASGIAFIMMAWSVQQRGPLYAAVFNPLMLIIVAIAGSLILNEKLYLGSVLGGVLIVIGLYVVLWGKSMELKSDAQLTQSKSVNNSVSRSHHIDVDEDNILSTSLR